jgi:hypothetical protein
VLNWKKNFRRKWYYKLKKICELHLNADNNLVFKPADQTNYLTTAFGLTSLFSIGKRAAFEQNSKQRKKKQSQLTSKKELHHRI